jgi:hypothetical protein
VDMCLQAYSNKTSQDLTATLRDLSETLLQTLADRFSEV